MSQWCHPNSGTEFPPSVFSTRVQQLSGALVAGPYKMEALAISVLISPTIVNADSLTVCS